jgi:hypothetical protein
MQNKHRLSKHHSIWIRFVFFVSKQVTRFTGVAVVGLFLISVIIGSGVMSSLFPILWSILLKGGLVIIALLAIAAFFESV